MKSLVTGAASGLGLAVTEQLLSQGHEVVAIDRDTEKLDRLALESRGACVVRNVNLAKPEEVASLLNFLAGHVSGTYNMVVLNAGISATGKFEEIPLSAYDKLIHINLIAPLILASGLVANGAVGKGGKIILISSLSHATGYPGASVYSATKDALAVYARSVSAPWKKKGIRLLTVFPGPIRTDHAERHAPPGAEADKRMAPEVLAAKILKAARGNKKELYPGTFAQLANLGGFLFPELMTRMMRRAIFDKLEKNTFD